MRMRFKGYLPAMVALVGLAGLAMPTPARAVLAVTIAIGQDHGAQTIVEGPTLGSSNFVSSGSYTGFGVLPASAFNILNLSGTGDQSSGLTELLGTTLSLQNISGATHSIQITITITGYTTPVAPPSAILTSHIGGTVNIAGTANTLGFSTTVTDGTNTYTATNTDPGIKTVGSYNDDKSTGVSLLLAPFTMIQSFDIMLSANSKINFSTSSALQSVPEPSSLVMVASASFSILGLGLRRRVRRAKV